MRRRYVRDQALTLIGPHYEDSLDWRFFLRQRIDIAKCFNGGFDRNFQWSGAGERLTLANVWKTVRKRKPKLTHWKGIWASQIPKFTLLFWRVHRKMLPIADRVNNHDGNVDPICPLCRTCPESIPHLFFECVFSRWVLGKVLEVAGGLIDTRNVVDFDSFMAASTTLTHSSPI